MLRKFIISGTEISDISLRYITQYLHHLTCLKISGCYKISNDGIAQLSMPDAKINETLNTIDLSGCKQVSNQGLQSLSTCKNLIYVDCTNTKINNEGIRKFIDESSAKLKVQSGSIICPRVSKRSDICWCGAAWKSTKIFLIISYDNRYTRNTKINLKKGCTRTELRRYAVSKTLQFLILYSLSA